MGLLPLTLVRIPQSSVDILLYDTPRSYHPCYATKPAAQGDLRPYTLVPLQFDSIFYVESVDQMESALSLPSVRLLALRGLVISRQ